MSESCCLGNLVKCKICAPGEYMIDCLHPGIYHNQTCIGECNVPYISILSKLNQHLKDAGEFFIVTKRPNKKDTEYKIFQYEMKGMSFFQIKSFCEKYGTIPLSDGSVLTGHQHYIAYSNLIIMSHAFSLRI